MVMVIIMVIVIMTMITIMIRLEDYNNDKVGDGEVD